MTLDEQLDEILEDTFRQLGIARDLSTDITTVARTQSIANRTRHEYIETRQSIKSLIAERERLARVDEVTRISHYAGAWFRGDERMTDWIATKTVIERLAELKEEQ